MAVERNSPSSGHISPWKEWAIIKREIENEWNLIESRFSRRRLGGCDQNHGIIADSSAISFEDRA
jgi:hypothetical protein